MVISEPNYTSVSNLAPFVAVVVVDVGLSDEMAGSQLA